MSIEDNKEPGDNEPEDEIALSVNDPGESADDPVIDEIDLTQASIDAETATTEVVYIAVEEPTTNSPAGLLEDGSKPVVLNDANPDSEYASSIEIRGPPARTKATLGNQIVFVDSTLKSYFQPKNADHFVVVVEFLSTDSDGIQQITDILSNYQDVSAIHIISHGSPGQVQIGSVELSATSLDFYAEKIQTWGDTLSSDGDILFYGCNVGVGSTGQDFLNKIADLTGADVAASDDPTGAAPLDGDWILERTLGTVTSKLPFDPVVWATFPGLLDLAGISGLLTVPSVMLTTQVVDGTEFTHVVVPEWRTGGQIGQPELPVFRQSYAIPENADVASTFTILGQDTFGKGYLIYPMQEPEPASSVEDHLVTFAYDTDYYSGLTASETDVFRISEPLIAGDNHSVALEFRPFQYDPMTGEVSMVTELEFELSFVERTPAAEPYSESDEIAGSELVSVASEADYLIITADEFYDEILPLAQWKHRKGYKTHVARMSEVGTTDIDIKTFLQNAYDADPDKPEYVLLVGDHENVPSYTIVGHPFYGSGHVWHSDYDYALLAGTDLLADVAIGRLPGDTTGQIETMVKKTLDYERSPHGGYWYDDVLIAGQFQDSNDFNLIADRWFMEDQHRASDFLGGDYDFWSDPDPYNKGFNIHTNRVWDSSINNALRYRIENYPGRITPPDPIPDAWKFKLDDPISETINDGVSFVLHRDHGSTSGWAAPGFHTNDVNSLTNDDELPIVFSLNCETGHFDDGDYFGEAWLRNTNGGAVALTGAMRVSYSGPNDALHVGIFDAMWDDYDTSWESVNYEHGWRFGDLMNYAKDRVFSGYGYDASIALVTAQMFNVLGDPELMLRTVTPQELTVSHDSSIPLGFPFDVSVDVTIGGFPVEGALVCVSRAGTNDHWTGVTDAGGHVTLTGITAHYVDDYDIVVSSHNTDPYEGTIQVIPEGPFARLDTPAHGSFSNTDYGYVDIEWVDYFGQVGLNTATIDADDIWISGVTIDTPSDQGGGIWRYPYTGALTEGQVDVYSIAGQVQDNAGDWNVGQIFTFKYDANSPQGHLRKPGGGMTIYQDPGYVEISWSDMGPASLDISTLDSNDITITGVTIDGPPIQTYSNVYNYHYTGELPIGTITVTFVPGEVADLAGNVNADQDISFVYDPLRITTTSVLPEAILGTPYSVFIEADGGMEPYLYFYENINDNLVGWWKFDEMSGSTTVDSSGNGNHGTLVGAPEWVAGVTGGALYFDGSGDYVDCGNGSTLNITEEITVACSFKVDEFDKMWQTIIAKGDDSYRISRLSEGDELHWCGEGLTVWRIDGTSNVNDEQWHHVAGVYDGAMMYLYVDGILDRSLHSSGQINTSTYNLFIGENSENTSRYFDGLIDDVRIYNTALTGEEVNSLKNGAFFSLPPGLSLDISTGQISGTPTQPGTFEFIITVTDSLDPANQVSQSFSLEINGPYANLHEPVIGGTTNIDLGYVDIAWRDHPGVGIDTATIDAGDISISGVTIGTPTYQGSGIWRYPYTGTLSEGQVDVQVIAGQVQDYAGIGNVQQVFSFVYDTQPPTGTLSDPVNGATIYQYIGCVDVSWVDAGLANIDTSTLDSNDITITGVTVDGPPTFVSTDTYRYSYSGDLPVGTVTVTFVPGEVADLAGNVNTGHDEFFAYDPLVITTSSPLPQVSLGTPYSIFIEVEGGVAPYTWSEAAGNILITEINPDSPDTIEFTNVSGKDIDVSGWQIYIYDWDFHLSPQ
ncbi:C25 family cysteine peptidase, partial [Planctomycetota bacterium]